MELKWLIFGEKRKIVKIRQFEFEVCERILRVWEIWKKKIADRFWMILILIWVGIRGAKFDDFGSDFMVKFVGYGSGFFEVFDVDFCLKICDALLDFSCMKIYGIFYIKFFWRFSIIFLFKHWCFWDFFFLELYEFSRNSWCFRLFLVMPWKINKIFWFFGVVKIRLKSF